MNNQQTVNQRESMMWAIAMAAKAQQTEVDRLKLHSVMTDRARALDNVDTGITDWKVVLKDVCQDLDIKLENFEDRPDPSKLPAVYWTKESGWVVIRALAPTGNWQAQDYTERWFEIPRNQLVTCARVRFPEMDRSISEKPAYHLFQSVFLAHRKPLVEAGIATALISFLALVVSLFSMQVYDRVIPTKGYSTLTVLTIGVAITMVFEHLLKEARSYLTENNVIEMDTKLSREIFSKLLNVRMDQMPNSLGSLTAQIRGYESIRAFLSSSTLYSLVEGPFGVVFIILIGVIGSPWLMIPPIIFYIFAIFLGIYTKSKVEKLSKESMAASNKKTGILVEAIEGAETIKAGGGGWNLLSKWMDLNTESLEQEVALRKVTEHGTYYTMFMQQATYIAVVVIGAYLVSSGAMTQGMLIACTILTGRATAPASMLYQIINRYANAKAALLGIENLFQLQSDNHNVDKTIQLETIRGEYQLEDVRFSYQGAPRSLQIPNLRIKAGEKVGLLGAIGSGKSTLLRLLTGMYQPLTGKILLDSVDISQISRVLLSDKVGYLQQEHRLFNGTLRENLLIGTIDPGDEAVRSAAQRTGLLQVVSSHPLGLELPIQEGGRGLSGGQRQLVAMTRLLISNPSVWLLDEPTANMDQQTADRCLNTLREAIRPEHTLVLVTHNPKLLTFVDRLVIVANNRVVVDGPRDEVLNNLKTGQAQAQPQAAAKA